MLASKSLEAGKRVFLLSRDEASCVALSNALWRDEPASFLAHDFSGSERQADQPILISDQCQPVNGAPYIILSDGLWREEAVDFERAFFLFTADQIDHARTVWRELTANDAVTPRYWKQDGGRWVEGP